MDVTAPIAHASKDGRKQLVSTHLLQVSAYTRQLAEKLSLSNAGALIGLLHDAGKATAEFQSYLRSFQDTSDTEPQDELRGKVDHSTAGAQILWRQMTVDAKDQLAQEFAALLALPIVSHHSGLIDCVAPAGEDVLAKRLVKADSRTRSVEAWQTFDASVRASAETLLQDPALRRELRLAVRRALHGEGNREIADRHHLQFGLMVRLLFSCLIDADRTDAINFERGTGSRPGSTYERWDVLLTRLETTLSAMPTKSEVNRIRRDVSAACAQAANRATGIYRLTVPTGGGKTLAAMRFALRHAALRALSTLPVERVIFVSPYISIVEQNSEAVRAILEGSGVPAGSIILEHHSNLGLDETTAGREHWRRKVLTENWDAPVVFTTMAQVLESLFGGGTRAVRRLHAMVRAVIVFDEAQTLPVKLLHLFNNAVNYLARECGTTVLMCTATQPRLDKLDAKHGALQLAPNADIIQDVGALFRSLRRYTVVDETERSGGWTQADVAEAVCALALERGSCLAVLNTKKDVRAVFQQCRERLPGAVCVHLSTGMCPAHRAQSLQWLKRLLVAQAAGENVAPILCVSTNLIEAGVDIDFAAVVRDLAGLDSMAQAAGRCNRHGRRPAGGHVLLVQLPDPPAQLEEVLHGRKAARRVLGELRRKYPGEAFPLDSPELMNRYFDLVNHERAAEMGYSVGGKNAERDDTLLCMLGSNGLAVREAAATGRPVKRQLLHQSFAKAAEAFQMIAPTEGVVVPYRDQEGNDGRDVIASLCAAHDLNAEWQLLRKAQRYTLSLYDLAFRQLVANGAAYEAKAGRGVFCLRAEWYDPDFGLRDNAGPLEDLIG